jgi:restriction endonuclease S subunit
MTGTNYPAITPTDLEQFKIALPNEDAIQNIQVKKLDLVENSISKVKSQITSSKSLQQSLINQIF